MSVSNLIERSFNLACRTRANVLITGPTGTGKTHMARRIHEESSRASKPFIVVNLATLHEGLIESELFGHERGAFTGAEQRRTGKLELAHGGTVFLDEIGDLSPRLQARLLEFLQSRTIFPVGGNREIKLDVRVIAATHKDLEIGVAKGAFREDLFHRLRVVSIDLPSLRDRADDFDGFLHACLEDVCEIAGKSVLRISEDVAARFEAYDWPGNIRELRNVLEYAVLASEGIEIQMGDLPDWFLNPRAVQSARGNSGALGVAEIPLEFDFYGSMAYFEREFLSRALKRFGGRIGATARKLGMSKTTLLRRLKALGIHEPRNLSETELEKLCYNNDLEAIPQMA
jgi:DNA-binding NtrC family response regulator